jgi:hypothetical protein
VEKLPSNIQAFLAAFVNPLSGAIGGALSARGIENVLS